MSYDLVIWHSTNTLSYEDADLELASLCDPDAPLVRPHAYLEAFVKELTKKYPQLDDVPENRLDESPWTCGFDAVDNYCFIPIAWSRVEEVVPYTVNLALKLGLTCLDRQSNKVYQPKDLGKAT